jgi:hypothetical protein
MPITVYFDNADFETFANMKDVKKNILDAHANGVGVDRIVDEETEQEYACEWDVDIVKN